MEIQAFLIIALTAFIVSLFIPFIRKTIGLLLIILGAIVTFSLIGAIFGIPMIVLGGILLFIGDPSQNVKYKNSIIQELEEVRIECPFCAELIKPIAKICRYCGKEITEKSLEESGFTKKCPYCSKVLKPNLRNCVFCDVELYFCDNCDSYVLKEDKTCPICSTNFDD